MRTLFAASLLIAVGAVIPAAATPITNQIFVFTGTCTDCDGTVTATLILDSLYTPGTEFTANDVVSFTYGGSNFEPEFTFFGDDPDLVADGTMPASFPGFADLNIYETEFQFVTSAADGTWYLNDNSLTPADYGTNGTWVAPEPTTIGLAGTALVALAVESFRRRRNLLRYAGHEKDCTDHGRE